MREALFLLSRGVPWDIAISVDDITRFAWCVIFQEIDGAKFDDERMEFVREDP